MDVRNVWSIKPVLFVYIKCDDAVEDSDVKRIDSALVGYCNAQIFHFQL